MARRGSAPELVLGIDFGTTKSVMAVVLDDDVEVLQNDIGSRSTPSCVHASMDAGAAVRDVGEAALRLAVSHPLSTVRNVKSVLGRAFHDVGSDHHLGSVKLGQSSFGEGVAIHLEDVVMAAEEITSMLLVHLKKAAEEQLGRGISDAVIAVPAYFNAAQRRSVVDAAYLAGLRVPLLVNDTSAAALVYARERVEPKTVLVVDVGGGGSSVAVVRTEDGAVRVLAASGRRLPGGEDFDARMVDYFKEVIRQTHGREVTTPRSQEILRGQWENAKHKLSRIPSTKISTFLPDCDIDFQENVSRATFGEQCRPLFEGIFDEVKRTLRKAKVAVNQVDDVVLVGGSSRIPALRDMVQSVLANRAVCKAVSADEAVAKGAALLAAQCVRLVDVTPLAMKVIAAGKEVDVDANTVLPLKCAMPGIADVTVRQGRRDNFGDEQTSFVTILETRDVLARTFGIDHSGRFYFFDVRGAFTMPILRGCISGQALTQMLDQVKSRIQDEEADRQRFELKNELEERCRAHLSQEPEAVLGDPDENLVSDLRRGCELQLQWLDANPAASMEELDARLAAVTGLGLDLDDSREQRRAASIREADRQRIVGEKLKMRKKLEDMCLSHLQEPEAAHGDPDADLVAALRRECRSQLQWLDSDAELSLQVLEHKLALVSSQWLHLKESREQRKAQREAAERLQREAEVARKQKDAERIKKERENLREAERIKKERENLREAERIKEELENQREAERLLMEAKRKQREAEKLTEDQRKLSEDQRKQREADVKKEAGRRQRETFVPRQAERHSHVVEKRPDARRSDQGAGDDAGPRDPRVASEDSVRHLYECVFRSEALRRKSFSLQPKDPSSRHPATRVLRALADVEAARALQAASAAGRAVLLVERVAAPGRLLVAPGRLLVALSVRFLDGEAGRRPVERLLMLRDALTTSGGDLLDRLDALLAEAGVAVAVRGVAWEEARGPVASAASQLLDLLQARAAAQRSDVIGTALVPTRTWSGSHCFYKRIAAACAEREDSVRAVLEAADELQELLGGAGLGVLRRACPAVTPEAWGTLEGVVRVLADPRGLGDVIGALEQLRRLEALAAARLERLLLALRDSTLHVAARILAAVFAAAKGVADLLAFSGPADLAAVQRCLAALRDVSAVAAAARGSTGGRLRFQSARAASPLVAGVTAAALECVEASVRHSALPLWTRHILVADDDDVFLQDAVRGAEPEDAVQGVGLPHAVRGVEPDALRAVLADLRRFRQQRSDAGAPWRCPRRLLAGCCRAPLRADFPALEDALQALATAAAPTGPCCRQCSAADGEALPVESLRDSLLGAGRCPEDVLEPTMILLSSTDWTATHQHCLDVSRVLEHLCAEDPSEVECSGPQ